MCVTDFAKSLGFWTGHFNLKPSDLLHDPEGRDITTFMHLDRGHELVDHHCFFFFEGPKSHVHHSSFEVFDFDTQVLGHDWLIKKGYENCWGVGRHILGSQIFDYWYVCACAGGCGVVFFSLFGFYRRRLTWIKVRHVQVHPGTLRRWRSGQLRDAHHEGCGFAGWVVYLGTGLTA